ncbi:MAG: hypothetical protein COA79_16010 [Planctomycetota bacterium]|nr:MAG: hypothetical protein COA79_16010 [Planctomycetota bacterium]
MRSSKLLFVFLSCFIFTINLNSQEGPSVVSEIEKMTNIKAGLCTILNCSDAKLPLAVAAGGKFLVHGITNTIQDAATIRKGVGDSQTAGMISIEYLPVEKLPYNNRSIDLIIVESDLLGLIKKGLSAKEVLRVLIPKGKTCFGFKASHKKEIESWLSTSKVSNYKYVKGNREWLVITKKRNKDLDDWGHSQHGPDGNPVSRDKVLKAPNLLQWIVGPTRKYGRGDSGPLVAGPKGVVSADGRNYYLQGRHIIARNAFNGTLLWYKSIVKISKSQIVAVGENLFVCLAGKLIAINGLTGETKTVYAESISCSKLLVEDQNLVVVGRSGIKNFDIKNGKESWSFNKRLGSVYMQAGKLYGMLSRSELVCLSLNNGKENWKVDVSSLVGEKATLKFISQEMLVFLQKQNKSARVVVLKGADGSKAWEAKSNRGNPLIFEASNSLWIESSHQQKGMKGVKSLLVGYDIKTGKEKLRHVGPENVKYRCHGVYATDRFFIANRPLYFMDWKTGKSHAFEGTRAQCGIAYCLAQGMFYGLYTTPTKCMCVSTVIAGITAFSSNDTMNGEVAISKKDQLRIGKASLPVIKKKEDAKDVWPIYRNDPRRMASSGSSVSTKLKIEWKTKIKSSIDSKTLLSQDWKISRPSGDQISPPTIGGGMLFASLPHEHQVIALHIASGKVAWRIHTPARVTAPPSYYQGLCLYACHDGRVYCVRSDNGELLWSFRAAPDERRMMAYGQIESSWPIAGGVLLVNGIAYVVAGRLTETDGGLYISALDPKTGKLLWTKKRGRVDDKPFGGYQPRRMQTYVGPVDMLCSDGKIIGMAGSHRGRFNCKTGDFISHYNNSIPFGYNVSRFRTDQYGLRTVPVTFLRKSFIGIDWKTKSVRRYGKNGWQISLPSKDKVESMVAITDNIKEEVVNNWRPSVRVSSIKNAPVIDGKIDPIFQKEGTPLIYSYLNGRKNKPQEATTAWILSDDKNLYLAFRCFKKDPNKIVCTKTKRDDAIWKDEAVEFFLDPTNSRKKSYYHFIINAAGVIQDVYKGDKKWNCEMTVKTGKESDAWTIEVKIPFKSLNITPGNVKKLWSVNFNRSARDTNDAKKYEDTAWSPTGTDSSHLPDMFGYMWLNAGKGGDDTAAYKKWFAGLPVKPKVVATVESNVENLLLIAVAKDSGDMNKGGELLIHSLSDGKILGRCILPISPAYDGLAVAGGRVYITLRDTSVVCLSKE